MVLALLLESTPEVEWGYPLEIVPQISKFLAFGARVRKFCCEKILSAAIPLRTIPQQRKAYEVANLGGRTLA